MNIELLLEAVCDIECDVGGNEKRVLLAEDGLHAKSGEPHNGADDHGVGDAGVVGEGGDPLRLAPAQLGAKVGAVHANRGRGGGREEHTTRNQSKANQAEFEVGEIDPNELDDCEGFEVDDRSFEAAVVDVFAVVVRADVVAVVNEGGEV